MIDFTWVELQRLEKLGCIEKIDGPSYMEVPISLVYSNKWMLLMDSSHNINPYARKQVFLEDLVLVAGLVEKNAQVINYLNSGY